MGFDAKEVVHVRLQVLHSSMIVWWSWCWHPMWWNIWFQHRWKTHYTLCWRKLWGRKGDLTRFQIAKPRNTHSINIDIFFGNEPVIIVFIVFKVKHRCIIMIERWRNLNGSNSSFLVHIHLRFYNSARDFEAISNLSTMIFLSCSSTQSASTSLLSLSSFSL